MNSMEFKQRIAEAQTEMEVWRTVHYFFAEVHGTHRELLECLMAADARVETLLDGPPTVPSADVALEINPADETRMLAA